MVSHLEPAGRLKSTNSSGIRLFFALVQQLSTCINLSLGEPDFCALAAAMDEGWKAVREGKTHYAPTNGVTELRDALAQRAYRDYGLNYDPNCEILVTVGGTEALFTT